MRETLIPSGNPAQLLKLADRDFRQLTQERQKPQPSRKFKPVKLTTARFDQSWDRKRGAAARLNDLRLKGFGHSGPVSFERY